jgi:hypothetical protein
MISKIKMNDELFMSVLKTRAAIILKN